MPKVVRVVRGKDPLALEAHSVFHGTYFSRLKGGVAQNPEWIPVETLGGVHVGKFGKGPEPETRACDGNEDEHATRSSSARAAGAQPLAIHLKNSPFRRESTPPSNATNQRSLSEGL